VHYLWVKSKNFIRDMYPSDKMSIPFEQVEKKVFKDVEETMCSDLHATFKKAVQIYVERNAEIKIMELSLREHLKAYGVDLEKSEKLTTGGVADASDR
jgi:hypothetical protein